MIQQVYFKYFSKENKNILHKMPHVYCSINYNCQVMKASTQVPINRWMDKDVVYVCVTYTHKYTHTHMYMCLVTQSCPTLCDPMDCSLPGSSVNGDSPSKNTAVGCPGDLPNPGTEPRSPTLQADSLPSEPPGKPYIYMCMYPYIHTHTHTHTYIWQKITHP